MKTFKARALIISRLPPSHAAKRLADELLSLDIQVSWFFPEQRDDTISEALASKPNLVINRLLGDEVSLSEVLNSCSELEASLPESAMVINDIRSVRTALSKSSQSQALTAAGLDQVKEISNVQAHDHQDLLSRLGLPYIIKPDTGYGGDAVSLCSSPDDLRGALREVGSRMAVAQAFIPSASITSRLLMFRESLIVAYRRIAEPGKWKANFSQGATLELYTPTESERQSANLAMECIGLDIGGVDLVAGESGPIVLEINPSPGLAGAEKISGHNIAGQIAQHSFGKLTG